MLVKFIYHFPPVLLLHSLKLRRVCLPLGDGEGRRGGGGPSPRPSEGKREGTGLSQRPWRRGPKAGGWEESACASGNMYVWACVCMRLMCMCLKMCVYLGIYMCMYVYVGVAKNMCGFLSHALSPWGSRHLT